jgi:hypothetical protein
MYIGGLVMLSRRDWLRSSAVGAAGVLLTRTIVAAEPLPAIAVYKYPACECCVRWIKHLSANGFVTTVRDTPDMDSVKRTMGVPDALQSCHTAVVGRYIVEGHVPADAIKKLLAEKPAVMGLAVPGMPMGSPGMEGSSKQPYNVIAFERDGKTRVYMKR